MNLNILYETDIDKIYKIRDFVNRDSIKVVLLPWFNYSDLHLVKKRIFSCFSVLQSNGVILLKCNLVCISNVIKWLNDNNNKFQYDIFYFSSGDKFGKSIAEGYYSEIFIVIYKDKKLVPFLYNKSFILNNNNFGEFLINQFSVAHDIILIIGDENKNVAVWCKNMCRNIICFMEKSYDVLLMEGIKRYEM